MATHKPKILLFSVPFSGHLTTIKEIISQFQQQYDFKLVITGWKNIIPDLASVAPIATILKKETLAETDPAAWTFPRVQQLLPDCLAVARMFKPDLIIYDFFSLEGHFVGKQLNIPFWCSIPAMLGPFDRQRYLAKKLALPINQTAMRQLRQRYHLDIDPDQIEMISDGFHLPGQLNIVWSPRSVTPKRYRVHRHPARYEFIGHPRGRTIRKPSRGLSKPFNIYFSLGTVVLNNLWNQQASMRKNLQRFIQEMTRLWIDQPYQIHFVSQGKKILSRYPSNWHVHDFVDQINFLSRADLFIMHGGNNSFQEAVNQRVPMVVLPFFGDQPLVGRQVKKLNIGINLGKDDNIDTKKSKSFLNEDLARKLDRAVHRIISDRKYYNAIGQLDLRSGSLKKLFSQQFQ